MATVEATPEQLVELKTEEAKQNDAVAEVPKESTVEERKAEGDVNMDEDEKDKKLRAVRQSKPVILRASLRTYAERVVRVIHSRILLCGCKPSLRQV